MTTKTIKLSSLKANLAREEAGDWIEYPEWPGVAFNVSSLHKEAYTNARDMAVMQIAKSSKGKLSPGQKTNANFGKLYAEHILHDWRGLDEPYSPELAMQILTDPAYREVVAAVEWCAAKLGQIEVAFVGDAVKNSGPPTDGGSKDSSAQTG